MKTSYVLQAPDTFTPLSPHTLPYESTKCFPLTLIPPVAFVFQSCSYVVMGGDADCIIDQFKCIYEACLRNEMTLESPFLVSSIRMKDESRLELEADIGERS